MTDRVLVINPNSTEVVTQAMDKAFDPLRLAGGPQIESVTNLDGPPGIESQQHVDQVSAHICNIIKTRDNDAGAFVIACFSDPGMFAAREVTAKPVFGIAESGILSALSLGMKFGVIAILPQSIPRHIRYIRSLGLESRLAGDLAIGLGVTELADEDRTFSRMVQVSEALRDEKGADVLVMGCAGMARYRTPLEEKLGIAVVDPAQAAVAMAIPAIRLGQTNSTRRAVL
jgi:Asp/Glu/hydantoin racemase